MTQETQGHSSSLVDRAKNILLRPKAEWDRIDAEPASVESIFRGYVLILAAVPVLATLVGSLLFGHRAFGIVYRPGVGEALFTAVLTYVLSLASVFLLSLVIDALAPTFGGTRNKIQATKVAAYSMTASWVAGIFGLLPQLAMLAALIGGLYGLYLLYLGLPRLMKVVSEKAIAYTASVVVAAIVLWIVVGMLTVAVTSTFINVGPPAGQVSGTLEVPGVGAVDIDEMEAAAKRLEESARRMEAQANNEAAAEPAE